MTKNLKSLGTMEEFKVMDDIVGGMMARAEESKEKVHADREERQ